MGAMFIAMRVKATTSSVGDMFQTWTSESHKCIPLLRSLRVFLLRGAINISSLRDLIPAHTQSIRHAIDVVEPGCDQGDLQNSLIIKTSRSQPLMILLRDARRIARKLCDVIKHLTVLL